MGKQKNKKNPIIGLSTRNEIRRRIEKAEEKAWQEGRELTSKEIRKIEKTVIKKHRRENLIRALFLTMGIGIGVVGHAGYDLLTSGNGSTGVITEIDKDKVKPLNPINMSDLIEGEIREKITKEINNLESPEEILNYVKEIYMKAYNEEYNTNITTENLQIHKSRFDIGITKDAALNGDEILRGKWGNGKIDTSTGVITARVEDGEKIDNQMTFYYDGKYRTVYSSNEEVEKYEDNFLSREMAEVVSHGINYYVAEKNTGTSNNMKEQYKERLIQALTDYYTRENSTIQLGQNTKSKTQPEEDYEIG